MEYFQEASQEQRIQRIQEQLYGINRTIRESKPIQISNYENYVNYISEKILQHRENLCLQQDSITNDISSLQVATERTKKLREKYFLQLNDYLQVMEQKVIQCLSEEERKSQEIEYRIRQNIEEKYSSLSKEIIQEKNQRNDIIENIQSVAASEIPKFQESLYNEQMKQNSFTQTFTIGVQNEVQSIYNQLQAHEIERIQSDESLIQMSRNIIEKFRIDLESEKQERVETEEILIKLLEETCVKIT